MSDSYYCSACLRANHRAHNADNMRPGVIGGAYCPCRGECDPSYKPSISEFLLARYDQEEAYIKSLLTASGPEQQMLVEYKIKRQIVEWHSNWPVLVEGPTEYQPIDESWNIDTALNQFTFTMSRQIAWMTTQEYIKMFGHEPPTAPILRMMAALYSDHPDYQEEWKIT